MKLSEKKLRRRTNHELAGMFLQLGDLRLERRKLVLERKADLCERVQVDGDKVYSGDDPCWKLEGKREGLEGHGWPDSVVFCPACLRNGERRKREKAIALRVRSLLISSTYCARAEQQAEERAK